MILRYLICMILFLPVSLIRAQEEQNVAHLREIPLSGKASFSASGEIPLPMEFSGADTLLSFRSTTADAGTISEDDAPTVYTFVCRNVSSSRVAITRITTSCGCTAADADRPLLFPGDTARIRVTYNPFGRPGEIYTRILVYTDRSDDHPAAILTLTGNVTPSAALFKSYRYTMGPLRLRRREVSFGTVRRDAHRIERIACANAGVAPLEIKAVQAILPPYIRVYTRPACLQPSEEGQLIVAIDGYRLPPDSGGSKTHRILLDIPGVLPTERMITVILQY